MVHDFVSASAGDHLLACANALALVAAVLLTRFILIDLLGRRG